MVNCSWSIMSKRFVLSRVIQHPSIQFASLESVMANFWLSWDMARSDSSLEFDASKMSSMLVAKMERDQEWRM